GLPRLAQLEDEVGGAGLENALDPGVLQRAGQLLDEGREDEAVDGHAAVPAFRFWRPRRPGAAGRRASRSITNGTNRAQCQEAAAPVWKWGRARQTGGERG